MGKIRVERGQTHITDRLEKGGSYMFEHRFYGSFRGTVDHRIEKDPQFVVRISTNIKNKLHDLKTGTKIYVNEGNLINFYRTKK